MTAQFCVDIYTCFWKPAYAFAASRTITSCQDWDSTEAAGFGYSRFQVSKRAVWICAAPGSWFWVLQLILSAALMAICRSPWSIFINSKYLAPLLGTTGILVLESFVNNVILLGTQGLERKNRNKKLSFCQI